MLKQEEEYGKEYELGCLLTGAGSPRPLHPGSLPASPFHLPPVKKEECVCEFTS